MSKIIKDITVGQYFPGESILHKLDPRIKIVSTLLFSSLIFFINRFSSYALLGLFIFFLVGISKIPIKFVLKGIKSTIFFISITSFLNIFFTTGTVIFKYKSIVVTREGLYYSILIIARMFFLMIVTSLLTMCTLPTSITNAIESLLLPLKKFKLPTHEFAMMVTIAIRFIPTISEEIDKIMKAQTSRGADFESKNIFKKSKFIISILVPLFANSFRRADELALAMECRCYNGGENRTKFKRLQLKKIDAYASFVFIIFAFVLLAI